MTKLNFWSEVLMCVSMLVLVWVLVANILVMIGIPKVYTTDTIVIECKPIPNIGSTFEKNAWALINAKQ